MTIIVATDRGMWADSKCSAGNQSFPTEKVFAHKGDLIGTAGNNRGIQKFLMWYRGTRKKSIGADDGEEWEILVVNKRGILVVGQFE